MDQAPEKITVDEALEFFRGEANAAHEWLKKFRDGVGLNRRGERHGALAIAQYERALKFRRWVVNQLEKSQRKG